MGKWYSAETQRNEVIIMKEIGSEFSFVNNHHGLGLLFPFLPKSSFVFSGRTAIETIIKNTSIQKIAFPSYCCDSMLVPFRENGIEVVFYNVNYDDKLKINFSIAANSDAVLWCNYFGFNIPTPDITAFKESGGIIIEDITHSFFSTNQYNDQSDYLVASLRKWEPIVCGGYCCSVNGELKEVPVNKPPIEFVHLKKNAMMLKSKYLETGNESLKPEFLSMFKEANEWLANNYSGLSIDEESEKILNCIDADKERSMRRNNAKAIYDGIKEIDYIRPMFRIDDMDCPLFVPVIIDRDLRDKVRKKLIDNKIYCPVHWPRPNADCNSNLYDMELSLICDQRYNESDMQRIISVLKETL